MASSQYGLVASLTAWSVEMEDEVFWTNSSPESVAGSTWSEVDEEERKSVRENYKLNTLPSFKVSVTSEYSEEPRTSCDSFSPEPAVYSTFCENYFAISFKLSMNAFFCTFLSESVSS